MAKRAVFLDRDGTLIEEANYLSRVEDMNLFPFTAEAVRTLSAAGFLNILVTNQSAVARGLVTEDGVARIHAALSEQLERQGARLDDIYYCPHHPDAVVEEFRKVCDCRKPSPGLLLRAASRWDIDLGASYVIGDRIGDLEAGRRAGCHPLLVKTGYGSVTAADLAAAAQTEDNRASLPERTFENLLEAARWIVNRGMKDEG